MKLYLNDIVKLYNLPARCSDTIHALLGQMTYDGIITLSAPAKRRIAAQLGTTISVIDNQLSRLTKTDVLQRVDRGEYMLNPSLFAKGSWADVRRLRDRYIELRVSYNERTGKREISSTFNEGEEE